MPPKPVRIDAAHQDSRRARDGEALSRRTAAPPATVPPAGATHASPLARALTSDLVQLVDAFATAQSALAAEVVAKGEAMRRGDMPSLLSACEREEHAVAVLQNLVKARARLLDAARQSGFAVGSLEALVGTLGTPECAPLAPRLARMREEAARLRKDCWSQWVTAQRTRMHYTALVESIAQGGFESPIYRMRPTDPSSPAVPTLINAQV